MSASMRATLCPAAASAAARFTVTDDLPTPPLPLTIAYTLVSEEGWANGITRSGRAAAERGLHVLALLLAHHVELDPHAGHAGERRHRPGDPGGDRVPHRAAGHGQVHADGHDAVGADLDGFDHAEFGDRAADLGVVDAGQRGHHLIAVGSGELMPHMLCAGGRPRHLPPAAAGTRAGMADAGTVAARCPAKVKPVLVTGCYQTGSPVTGLRMNELGRSPSPDAVRRRSRTGGLRLTR